MSANIRPVQWEIIGGGRPLMPHRIHEMRQRDGSVMYSVMDGPFALTHSGEWEYEPIPSSRDDEYLARARFRTIDEALAVYATAALV